MRVALTRAWNLMEGSAESSSAVTGVVAGTSP
jgi:hypothetical protein